MEVVHLNESDFSKAMLRLRSRGGEAQRAYAEAARIIISLCYGVDELNKLTNKGESRIKHCKKYDLPGAHRLVTVQTDGFIYLLFIGDHQEVQRWLDLNRGLVIAANKKTKRIFPTYATEETGRRPFPPRASAKANEANLPYLKRLPGFDLSEFVSREDYAPRLLRLNDDTSDQEILELLEKLDQWNGEIANLMLNIISDIREGKMDRARARIEQFRGDSVPVQQDSQLELEALADAVNSDSAKVLSRMSEEDLKRLFDPERFQDWMLWLHPEQERIAKANYSKPTVLTGVSGSGKTCVIVHRARHLARKYPGQRIGILTLNRSLSRLIDNLVKDLCSPAERQNIVVMASYDYFKSLVDHFGPKEYLAQLKDLAANHQESANIARAIEQVDPATFAREFDPVTGQTLLDVWESFVEQNHSKQKIADFSRYLSRWLTPGGQATFSMQNRQFIFDFTTRQLPWIDPNRYLKEEFSLIRSSFSVGDRAREYLDMERIGRAIPLPKNIRELVLDLLLLYEEAMLRGRVLDELSLAQAVLPSQERLGEMPENLRFRCLLVDEYQDFSTLDLLLLRRIATGVENGFFLAGDPVQRITVKSLKMGSVGLDITRSTRERITRNYRNGKQILQAAALLANQYFEKTRIQDEDVELLDPELAVTQTAKPVALRVRAGEEISAAWRIATECLADGTALPWSVNIASASPERVSVEEILSGARRFHWNVQRITGDYTRAKDTLTVGSMSDVKGFEFSMIIVVGCGKDNLPTPGQCAEERWREALRLYVAMTRGRDQVCLIYSGEPSEFLEAMRPMLKWEDR